MRILNQTGGRLRAEGRWAEGLGLLLVAGLVGSAPSAKAQESQIRCTITENGSPGRGTVLIEKDGRKVASGSCARTYAVPPGKFKATLRLDGALDNPARTVEVDVAEGQTASATANFQTAMLEVRVEAKGQRGTGLVAVEQDGRRIGTLGSGVGAKLSAGRYDVVVRLRGQEKRYEVELRPGQRRLVRAQF